MWQGLPALCDGSPLVAVFGGRGGFELDAGGPGVGGLASSRRCADSGPQRYAQVQDATARQNTGDLSEMRLYATAKTTG
jgi:hypothetical protein